ncbi:molecular chaperone HtpG, partial [Burkholderia pseudomallei]
FDGKPLASVARGDLDLGALNDAEKKAQEETGEAMKPVVDTMKETLGEKVKDVRVTFRLADSPSCLVADDNDLSGYLQ